MEFSEVLTRDPYANIIIVHKRRKDKNKQNPFEQDNLESDRILYAIVEVRGLNDIDDGDDDRVRRFLGSL
ncbi:jg10308 [Pararge aegeria aegeria]|uniref:Jg10308 protein n=1 Tax=Pararge aegeria aegeria TaxID=348720 RepID=A0A8S4RY93_9NEOP|nr:jg10308 [Pararge aegeria aegeria]